MAVKIIRPKQRRLAPDDDVCVCGHTRRDHCGCGCVCLAHDRLPDGSLDQTCCKGCEQTGGFRGQASAS